MAITQTTLDSGVNITTTGAYTTNSVTAADSRWIAVAVSLIANTRTATVTGTGLTFAKVSEGTWASSTLSWHVAQVPASGFTGQLTITPSSTIQQGHWSVHQLDGVDLLSPVAQVPAIATGSSTTMTAALGDPRDPAGSRSFIVVGHAVFQGCSASAGTVELADQPGNSPAAAFAVGWSDTTWEPNLTFTVASTGLWGALAIEFQPPRPAAGLPVPVLRSRRR